ncbi:MAG: tyrosine-type recombinase/integrase [Fusobacteriaceae bacterium]|jgi:integrase|nr:tyrosine-type recombinase/integrase [Fusobacteriaceae bacterium]
MNTRGQEVYYIKTNDIISIRTYLEFKKNIVFLAFFNIGVNTGLRFSDLSQIKFENITKINTIFLNEKKTNKKRTIVLNYPCMQSIKLLEEHYKNLGYQKDGYLFKRMNKESIKKHVDLPFSLDAASKQFAKIKNACDIQYAIGTHSLRKTWGYFVYKKLKDITLLMKAFNHSSEDITIKYIGLDKDRIEEIYAKVEI